MGTTADKLNYLNGTKNAIMAAIEAKGVEIPTGTTFRGLAALIETISVGSDLFEIQGGELTFDEQTNSAAVVFDTPMENAPEMVIMYKISAMTNSMLCLALGVSSTTPPIASNSSSYRQVILNGSSQNYVSYQAIGIDQSGYLRNASAQGFSVNTLGHNRATLFGTYVYIAISLASNNA